jgi:hypothetical protein
MAQEYFMEICSKIIEIKFHENKTFKIMSTLIPHCDKCCHKFIVQIVVNILEKRFSSV